jgi:hypothetical protein
VLEFGQDREAFLFSTASRLDVVSGGYQASDGEYSAASGVEVNTRGAIPPVRLTS